MTMPAKLGKYEIRRELGAGAMGVVYEGWDPGIARRVAIKTVQGADLQGAEAEQTLARFRHEAQAAGRLSHPNIVEDPVGYQLLGVGQMQVNPKINLTFAAGLRSILRQDPDVIMIGEIRDRETAEIAIHASLTGHLVFSTLHTNDAASAATRLIDMGIEPFLVASSVVAVLAQRLLRQLCSDCKQSYHPDDEELVKLGIVPPRVRPTFYRGVGCPSCSQTGYRGRTGIFELLVLDDEIRRLIGSKADATSIRQAAMAKGMVTLNDDGAEKVFHGVTTTEELMRITQQEVEI